MKQPKQVRKPDTVDGARKHVALGCNSHLSGSAVRHPARCVAWTADNTIRHMLHDAVDACCMLQVDTIIMSNVDASLYIMHNS